MGARHAGLAVAVPPGPARAAERREIPEIVVCEEHSQVYETWRERGWRGLAVVHVDFHCDMRGLLIDRRRQSARFITPAAVGPPAMDSGNFLGVAAMEGIVDSIHWVHDAHGGRRYDAGTVKYASDLSALAYKLRGRRAGSPERPLSFAETTFEAWGGMRPGQHLDIDWDGLASIDYAPDHARRLIDAFLGRDWDVVPETSYLVYSPGYSDPDRALFRRFIERLAERFAATVVRLPEPRLRPGLPKPPQDLGHRDRLKHRLVVGLHRVGVF